MTVTAKTLTHQPATTARRPRPLLSVMAWEARRLRASRLFWIQTFGLFCFLLFLLWAQTKAFVYSTRIASGFIAGTSAWGLLLSLPTTTLLLVLLLPFINADGVTRDLQRRTHELLMTTTLPGWAYVWGRYLMGLLVSLGLALLLLVAILLMGLFLHLTIPAYPLPQISAVLPLWVGMLVSATVLVSSVSFALGTIFPRLTTLVKIVILVGWVVGAVIVPTIIYFPSGPNGLPTWYINWDPTSALTALSMLSQYSSNAPAASIAQFQQMLLTTENKMPTIGAWFPSHLLLAGLSLLLVLVAALVFKRSRKMLS